MRLPPSMAMRDNRGASPWRPAVGKSGTYWAADARGPRAQQESKLEARLLLSRSEGGTVARAGGNTGAKLRIRANRRNTGFRANRAARSSRLHGIVENKVPRAAVFFQKIHLCGTYATTLQRACIIIRGNTDCLSASDNKPGDSNAQLSSKSGHDIGRPLLRHRAAME
jgi:hypothetical protein